jgi:Mg-chelatase subunit ChlD
MSKSTTSTSGGDRGVSELVGVVLLFGIVIAGSALIFMSGSAVTEEVRAEGRVDAAESTFLEIDGNIQSLAQKRGNDRNEIGLGSVDPDDTEIRETGKMTITINENSKCSATMELSALEYQDSSGSALIYEAGAIWKQTDSGLVTQKTPEIGYSDGSVQLEVISLAGTVENDEMNVDYNRTKSIAKTQEVQQKLFSEESCRRPKNVTVTVQSDYHEGWQNHLESQGATDMSTSGDTVSGEFTIDKEYDYVDFTGDAPGTVIKPSTGSDSFKVGDASPLFKGGASAGGADTTYNGTITFLGADNARFQTETVDEDTEVKQEVTLEHTEDVTVDMDGSVEVTVQDKVWYWDNETKIVEGGDQPPLEVAFVLDESGSMRGGKLDRARSATRSFLGVMKDDQGHRVALIGYDTYYRSPDVTVYEEFTEDQSEVAGSLSDLRAGGGTPIPHAIEETSDQFRADGTDDNKQIMVLVTDGKDRSARDPVQTAREEIPDGVTVYTIGVGDDVNEGVLQGVASYGADGSKYISVDDASELDSVFERIAKNETEKEVEVPNKEFRYETRTVTVPLEETTTVEKTVTRTIEKDDSESEGDMVMVSGEVTAEPSTVINEVEVDRKIEKINETETETVTKDVSTEISGENTTTIGEKKELGPERTKIIETETEYDLLTRPKVSVTMNKGSTVDLWGGQNLNAPTRSVAVGAHQNIEVEQGQEVTFDPSFRSCSASDRKEETIEYGGEEYNKTTCTAYGPGAGSSATVHVYNNTSTIDVADSADFQTDLEEMLTVDGTQYYKNVGGDLKAWNLEPNQVIVVVEAADSGGTDGNNVVMLVELGNSPSEVSGDYLVNVEVTSVEAEEDDDDDRIVPASGRVGVRSVAY